MLYYLEANEILCDEQNAYATMRSSINHLYILCTTLRNHKHEMKDTYACLIDVTLAFNLINHTVLQCNQLSLWRHERKNQNRQYLYRVVSNCIWNKTGRCYCSTMFNLYVYDLALEIKDLDLGISLTNNENKLHFSCLLMRLSYLQTLQVSYKL